MASVGKRAGEPPRALPVVEAWVSERLAVIIWMAQPVHFVFRPKKNQKNDRKLPDHNPRKAHLFTLEFTAFNSRTQTGL